MAGVVDEIAPTGPASTLLAPIDEVFEALGQEVNDFRFTEVSGSEILRHILDTFLYRGKHCTLMPLTDLNPNRHLHRYRLLLFSSIGKP